MDRALRLVAALALAIALYAASAQPVRATFCAFPDIAEAVVSGESVFVGTVTAVRNNHRWALVRVEEIWSGPDLPDTIEVRGSEIVDPNAWTDIDRTFLAGRRYLFDPEVQAGVLRDHGCTATSLWVDELLRFRPAAVRSPAGVDVATAEAVDPLGVVGPPAVAGGAGLALLGLVVVGRHRRRHAG